MKREIKVLTSRRPNSTCAGFCLSFQARWPILPTNSTPNAWQRLPETDAPPKKTIDNRYTYMIPFVMLARQITRSDAATPFLPYHILANPAVSCDYSLFCATAIQYPCCFQCLAPSL